MNEEEYLNFLKEHPEIKILVDDIINTFTITMLPLIEVILPIFEPIIEVYKSIENMIREIIAKEWKKLLEKKEENEENNTIS